MAGVKKSKKELSTDKRIKKEYRELKKTFAGIDSNKMELVDRLIQRAAFMKIQMEDLEKSIDAEGWTEEYQNGANQTGVKKSSSAEVYLQLSKQYPTIIKQLTDLVPAAAKGESKLDAFLNES